MRRLDGRAFDELRPLEIERDFIIYPEGSVLFSAGKTRVLCNVSIENEVPRWMKSENKVGGWITGDYAMLPRATHGRSRRESTPSSRSQEIKRLIGRSLRQSVDLEKLGERTCVIDCDVLQADGGTRTAAITGGYIALRLALDRLIQAGELPASVLKAQIAAVSVGIVDGQPLLDLCYEEDSAAEVDANLVMTSGGSLVEIQGTAEGAPFSRQQLSSLLDLAWLGLEQLFLVQSRALAGVEILAQQSPKES